MEMCCETCIHSEEHIIDEDYTNIVTANKIICCSKCVGLTCAKAALDELKYQHWEAREVFLSSEEMVI